jgi:hypothetical protein
MPAPTVWPLVLALGITLLLAGPVTSLALSVVGAVVTVLSVVCWVRQLLPGEGTVAEELASQRPRPIEPVPGRVESLLPGMPGYRVRLPEKIHPYSAGLKGGIVGGIVMPLPAVVYGLFAHGSLWFPINLLAGMVIPGLVDPNAPEAEQIRYLEQFHLGALVMGLFIHATVAMGLGLIYGVMLPTLPPIPRPLAWGGLLMPVLWTAVSYSLMGVVNPVLRAGVDWPWFIVSQFVFGVVAAGVVMALDQFLPVPAGILAGLAGGLVMPVPALLWSVLSGHGVWYPANLLAGMVLPGLGHLPAAELNQFHTEWLTPAIAIHAAMSVAFGVVYGLLLPRLPAVPGSIPWGGLLMPLLWTGASYGFMSVINPVLANFVDWPYFILSQFIYGIVAAIVVARSAKVIVTQ